MQHLGHALSSYLSANVCAEFPFRLVRLWRSWVKVVGEESALLARPLGHRHATLLLGAEDAAALQEATYYLPEILERVNGFLGESYFDEARLELLLNRVPLDALPAREPAPSRLLPAQPESLGGLSQRIPLDSPAGRAYRAYVALFKRGQD